MKAARSQQVLRHVEFKAAGDRYNLPGTVFRLPLLSILSLVALVTLLVRRARCQLWQTIFNLILVKQRTPLQAAGHVRAGHQLFEL